jgi:large subunit ribosomal protein L10
VLTRAQKAAEVEKLREKFARATSVFVADYRGLDVRAQNHLRSQLREKGAGEFEYRVTKNTLLRHAAEGLEVARISEHFHGPTAIALSYGDPVRLAKVLIGYAKEHEVFEVRAALVEGQPLGRAEIATLATLPTLEGLRARLVGLVQAPAAQIVRMVAEPGAQLARLVGARRAKLEEA